jgi:ATP adenylyltransferase
MDLLRETKDLLQTVLKPQGFNVGMNFGRVAGAGIPGHVHIHIVPRWRGDHNFMPVTASTKVISQSLSAIYKKLKRCVQEKTLRSLKVRS